MLFFHFEPLGVNPPFSNALAPSALGLHRGNLPPWVAFVVTSFYEKFCCEAKPPPAAPRWISGYFQLGPLSLHLSLFVLVHWHSFSCLVGIDVSLLFFFFSCSSHSAFGLPEHTRPSQVNISCRLLLSIPFRPTRRLPPVILLWTKSRHPSLPSPKHIMADTLGSPPQPQCLFPNFLRKHSSFCPKIKWLTFVPNLSLAAPPFFFAGTYTRRLGPSRCVLVSSSQLLLLFAFFCQCPLDPPKCTDFLLVFD